jgi:hypothetical protein
VGGARVRLGFMLVFERGITSYMQLVACQCTGTLVLVLCMALSAHDALTAVSMERSLSFCLD